MSQSFRDEVSEFGLVFTCEDCAHFKLVSESDNEEAACAVRYPTKVHRKTTVDALADGEQVFFCKMFEAS